MTGAMEALKKHGGSGISPIPTVRHLLQSPIPPLHFEWTSTVAIMELTPKAGLAKCRIPKGL